jgi:hypothetical protein
MHVRAVPAASRGGTWAPQGQSIALQNNYLLEALGEPAVTPPIPAPITTGLFANQS